jgi:hypothetical protein
LLILLVFIPIGVTWLILAFFVKKRPDPVTQRARLVCRVATRKGTCLKKRPRSLTQWKQAQKEREYDLRNVETERGMVRERPVENGEFDDPRIINEGPKQPSMNYYPSLSRPEIPRQASYHGPNP